MRLRGESRARPSGDAGEMPPRPARSGFQLWLAAAALLLGALDAYAVVTLLPQMMTSTDLTADRVEAATPIVTGFLGGYVVAMPLLGAYSDRRGRLPAFAAALAAFGLGSTLTAQAWSLGWLVAGRTLQGIGGGALVPLSLALAADLYPAGRRGLAVGAVSAVQEAGSVLGPIYGAALAVALGGWQAVFWLNLPVGALLLTGLWWSWRREPAPSIDSFGGGRGHGGVEWVGALLLGIGLGLAVIALYPDDPERRALNANAVPLGAAAGAFLVAFAWRQSRKLSPLVAPELLRHRAFAGSMLVNLLAGGALMVVLVDVPVVGRGVFDLDAVGSGLLLMRFLLGVPVGALAGGWLARRLGQRAVSFAGLILAGAAFALMSGWSVRELDTNTVSAWLELFGCGLGFGLVIAPITTAVLDQARTDQHGLASSLVVLSRTGGMVLALSSLTAFGLARFRQIFAERACDMPAGTSLREQLVTFESCVRASLLQEYREIFLVAAGLCALGAAIALFTLPGRQAPPAARRVSREAVPG